MAKGADKRQQIFDKYKNNLNLLIENGIVNGNKDFYVCPICLTPHHDLNSNDPLTLEDAPPKSLGGTANTLTCKSCNNTCGYKIDFHLTERLREIDNSKFIPNSETNVKVKINGEIFQGTLKVTEDGILKMHHSNKNNNPKKLEAAMKSLGKDMAINMEFLKSRVIPENLEYALLKTGYMLAFEKLGYNLIFCENYNIVREQLRNPEARIYPEAFWISPSFTKEMSGVYFVCDEGLECLLVLFNLNTGKSERMFGVFLPLPIYDITTIIKNIHNKFKSDKDIELELYPKEQDNSDYIDDLPNIKAMQNWIVKRINKNR